MQRNSRSSDKPHAVRSNRRPEFRVACDRCRDAQRISAIGVLITPIRDCGTRRDQFQFTETEITQNGDRDTLGDFQTRVFLKKVDFYELTEQTLCLSSDIKSAFSSKAEGAMTSQQRILSPSRSSWLGLIGGCVPAVMSVLVMLGLLAAATSFLPQIPQASSCEEPLSRLPTKPSVQRIQLTADGRHAHVYRHLAGWQLVDVTSGEILRERTFADQFCTGLQFVSTPTPGFIVDGQGGYFWKPMSDAESGRILQATSSAECKAIKASPECKYIACYHENAIQLRSIISDEICVSTETDHRISAIEWSPDGQKLLVLLGNGLLQVRHGMTLNIEQTHPTSLLGGGRLVWSSSGQHVVAFNPYGILTIWDLVTQRSTEVNTGNRTLHTVALSATGEFIVASDAFADVWLYPTQGDDTDRQYVGTAANTISAVSLIDDDQGLLVGTFAGELECWSLSTGLRRWTDLIPAPLSTHPDISSEASSAVPCVQRGDSCASTRS